MVTTAVKPTFVPRYYQQEAYEAVNRARANGAPGTLVGLPTGTGKTILYAMLALREIEQGGRVVILVPHDFLYDQGYDSLQLLMPNVKVGLVGFGEDNWNGNILFCSVAALWISEYRLKKLKEFNPTLVVADEAHISYTRGYIKILQTVKDAHRFGCTATIDRFDGNRIQEIFGNPVYNKSLSVMIDEEFLCDLKSIQVRTRVDFSKARKSDGSYDEDKLDLVCNCSDMNEVILKDYWKLKLDTRMPLVFCGGKQHARDLAALFNANGISAEAFIDGMTKDESKEMLSRFETRKTKVLFNVRRAEIGLNIPGIDCIILAAPTNSPGKYLQRIGRGTRLAAGKENCLIIDYTEDTERHDLNPTVHLHDVLGLPEIDESRSIREQISEVLEKEAKAPKQVEKPEDEEGFLSGDIFRFQKDLATSRKCQWNKESDGTLFSNIVSKNEFGESNYQITIIPRGYRDYETYVIPPKGDIWLLGQNLPMDTAERLAEKAARHLKKGEAHLVDPNAKWRSKPVSEATLKRLEQSRCPKNRYWKSMTQDQAYQVLTDWYAEMNAKSKYKPKSKPKKTKGA